MRSNQGHVWRQQRIKENVENILKQQYENFATSRSEGLDKTYDRFQKLISQLEIHGEVISQEDANLKRGHFAREYKAPRNQGNRNGDAPRMIVLVETPANALVVQDGIGGYDWSFQAKEGINFFALMAYTSKGSSSSSSLDSENEGGSICVYSRERDVDDSLVNNRFKTGKGFHAVPPPYIGNYMPSRPDLSFDGLDDSVYKTKANTSISKTSKDIVEKSKTVRPGAPIIEDWDTDSDNDSVCRPKSDQTKPRFTKINFVKYDENVKSVNKENTQRQVEYPRKTVVTKSGQVPVNTAKQSSPKATTSISTARPVNTAAPKPKVNDALPSTYSHFKAHSPVKRTFNQISAAKTNKFNEKVNTARVNNVTTTGPKAVVSGKMLVRNGEKQLNLSMQDWRTNRKSI
ncbi:hypothetical protein Tco_0260247 [Tanacetum coccineum]